VSDHADCNRRIAERDDEIARLKRLLASQRTSEMSERTGRMTKQGDASNQPLIDQDREFLRSRLRGE
jgi:hypothetical protein